MHPTRIRFRPPATKTALLQSHCPGRTSTERSRRSRSRDCRLTELCTATQAVALNGTVSASTVYFKPDANWSGATAFQYTAIDNNGLADASPATASITVAAVADTPVIHVAGT